MFYLFLRSNPILGARLEAFHHYFIKTRVKNLILRLLFYPVWFFTYEK